MKIQVRAMLFLLSHTLPQTTAAAFVQANLTISVMFAPGQSRTCVFSAFCLQELQQSSVFCGLSMLMNIVKLSVNIMPSFLFAQISSWIFSQGVHETFQHVIIVLLVMHITVNNILVLRFDVVNGKFWMSGEHRDCD